MKRFRQVILVVVVALLLVSCGGSGGNNSGSGNPQSGTYGSGVRYFFGSLRLLDDDVNNYTVSATLEQTGEQVTFEGDRFTLGNALQYSGESVLRFSGDNERRDFDVTITLPTDNVDFSGVELDVAVSVQANEAELERVEIYTPEEQDTVKDKVKRKPKGNEEAKADIDDLVSADPSSGEPERGETPKDRPTDNVEISEDSPENNSVQTDIMEEGIL